MFNNENSILNIGSVAFDSLEIRGKQYDKVVGGSATYFSLAASLYADVYLSAIVGDDFPKEMINTFMDKNINLDNFKIGKGNTFHWGGQYSDDLSSRETKFTNLGVFQNFDPKIINAKQFCGYLYLGNIQPELQLSLINQLTNAKKIISDTMNLWIDISNENVWKVIKKTDIFLLNDEEAIQLTKKDNLLDAAIQLLDHGPEFVIIKQGHLGSTIFSNEIQKHVPPNSAIIAQDPTGAGDSFAGALVGYIAKNGISNIVDAVIEATSLASFTVSDIGIDGLMNAKRDVINEIVNKIKMEVNS